jgi:tetratricopeptide (TPR) repeat protein
MGHLPEKRMGALARALSQALAEGKHPVSRHHGLNGDDPARALDDEQSFAHLVQNALSRTSRAAEERAAAPAQLAELLALPSLERETAVVMSPVYQTYALAAYTLERSEKAVVFDPALARELARLGRSIAMQADPLACGGSAALADVEAYALALEGNALRVAGELRDSFQVFMEARQVQERGGADPDLGARIDFVEASLRRDLRQFGAALHLLDRAGKVFHTLKDRNQMARTIINRANLYIVQGEFAQAAATLQGALRFSCEPGLALMVRHNLIDILAKSGSALEASRLFEESRELYMQFSDPLTTSRRMWVEGIIARELGEDLDLAEGLLTQAVDRLTASGYGFDAALAGLDLVTVYAARGQSAEVLRIATDLVQLFEARNVQPEALAALTMVYKAAQKETVSVALLAHVTELVRASQVLGGAAG